MKKKILFTSLLAGATLLAGCDMMEGSGSEETTTVTLWASGSDNVRDAYDVVIDAFHDSEYGENYEIDLQFVVSGSGGADPTDRLISAYEAGEEETEFDLIGMDFAGYETMITETGEDIFEAIDYDLVPNADNLTVDTHDHVLPTRGTTVVLAYDEERVDNPPTTDEELYEWIRENPGRFSYNHPDTGGAGSAFVRTAIYNFMPEESMTSDDESWMDEWDEGFELLADLHPHLYQTGGSTVYPNTNQGTLDLLANQEVDMIPAWADMAIEQTLDGRLPETTAITQIEPAFTGNMPGFAIPSSGTADREAIHAVLDFWVSDEAQEILLNEMAAIPLVDSSNFDSESADMLADFSVDEFRAIEIGNLGGEMNEQWENEIAPLD